MKPNLKKPVGVAIFIFLLLVLPVGLTLSYFLHGRCVAVRGPDLCGTAGFYLFLFLLAIASAFPLFLTYKIFSARLQNKTTSHLPPAEKAESEALSPRAEHLVSQIIALCEARGVAVALAPNDVTRLRLLRAVKGLEPRLDERPSHVLQLPYVPMKDGRIVNLDFLVAQDGTIRDLTIT